MPRIRRRPRSKSAPTPRKTAVGTTYQARGLVQIPKPNLNAESGSSLPTAIQEVVPELSTPYQQQIVYNKMTNDAAVDVSLRAAKTPILGAEFFVEPFSDQPLDIEIAEFIWANLAEGMSAPFLSSLEDILKMYEDGFSVLEKVYEQREWAPKRSRTAANTRQYVMLKKLGARPASTISDIIYDNNGGPESVEHNAIQKDKSVKSVTLPIDKILIFTFNRRGGDLRGRSLLRTAYPHWYYKTHLYKVDSIQKERHAIGVPRGKLLPGFTPQDRDILRTLLRNLRTNEESYVVQTPNVEIDFIKLEGSMVDVLSSANHHNTMILMNVLGQFISLGSTGEGGGRATAATQSDLFMKSLRYVANHIADQINMYLIPELVVWNYPTKNFPRLQVRNIGETRDLQMLAAALANLYAQDVVTPTPETEAWVRRVFDMPAFTGQAPAPEQKTETPETEPTGNGAVPKKGDVRAGIGKAGYVGQPPSAAD